MTVDEIESELNIIHMKYILSCTYSVSRNTIQHVSYEHLDNMIKKYYEMNNNDVEVPQIINVPGEYTIKKDDNIKISKSGWFNTY
jgi:hypothetical protein